MIVELTHGLHSLMSGLFMVEIMGEYCLWHELDKHATATGWTGSKDLVTWPDVASRTSDLSTLNPRTRQSCNVQGGGKPFQFP